MEIWLAMVISLITLIIGAVGSFFITRNKIQKHIKENPPITGKQIRAMYLSMGRKPSEAQIQKTLRSMNIKQ